MASEMSNSQLLGGTADMLVIGLLSGAGVGLIGEHSMKITLGYICLGGAIGAFLAIFIVMLGENP